MEEKKPFKLSTFIYPLLFVGILWVIKFYEIIQHVSLHKYGIYPRSMEGLMGILTGPLVHGDLKHLTANSIPLLILGSIIFHFYRPIAFQIFVWVYLSTDVWVWSAARDSYHIGASGLIYGFESFLFFSGIFRKNNQLKALSLLVVFLYGGTIWGILPIDQHISFESHALGALSGLLIAYHFRKQGPQNPTYDFGNDEENEQFFKDSNEETQEAPKNDPNQTLVINYEYVENKEK